MERADSRHVQAIKLEMREVGIVRNAESVISIHLRNCDYLISQVTSAPSHMFADFMQVLPVFTWCSLLAQLYHSVLWPASTSHLVRRKKEREGSQDNEQ